MFNCSVQDLFQPGVVLLFISVTPCTLGKKWCRNFWPEIDREFKSEIAHKKNNNL